MNKLNTGNNKRAFSLYTRVIFYLLLPFAVIAGLGSYSLLLSQKEYELKILEGAQARLLETATLRMRSYLDNVYNDLVFLKNSSIIREGNVMENEEDFRAFTSNIHQLLDSRKSYYQVRLLDLDGIERFRVERSGDDVLIDNDSLQDKSSRYYFRYATELPNHWIYLSSLDLNIENGVIETPYKPVIRFVTPAVNKAGSRFGYLIINVNMLPVIDLLENEKNLAGNSLWMANNKGSWSIAPDGVARWFKDGSDKKYILNGEVALNMVLEDILAGEAESGVRQMGAGVLNFKKIVRLENKYSEEFVHDALQQEDFPWVLISYIPDIAISGSFGTFERSLLLGNVFLLLVVIITAVLIARYKHKSDLSRQLLEDEKLFLDGFIQNAPFAMYSKDIHGRFTRVNPVSAEIMERDTKEIIGKSVLDLYPRSIAEPMEKNDLGILLAGERMQVEEEAAVANEKRCFISTKFPIFNHENDIVGLGGISVDITDLNESRKQLRRKESLYQGVFNNSFQFLAVLDENGTILEVNETAKNACALDPDDLIGQFFWNMNWWTYSEEAVKEVKKDFQAALEYKSAVRQCRIRSVDGKFLEIAFSIRAVRNPEGEVMCLLAEGRDISQIIETKNILRINNETLSAINNLHLQLLSEKTYHVAFNEFLEVLVSITGSRFGFIGEVLEDKKGKFLKTFSISNIAWDAASNSFYSDNREQGLEFHDPDSLLAATIRDGRVTIANDPVNDPRAGGLPQGHPSIDSFMGIPVLYDQEVVGMIGLANRQGGYDQSILKLLQPMVQTFGQAVNSFRSNRQKQKYEQALLASENRMKALIDAAPDGLMMVDSDGVIHLMNGQMENLCGYSRQELLGQKIELLIPDDVKPRHPALRQRYNEKPIVKASLRRSNQREIQLRQKDGQLLPTEVGLSPSIIENRAMVIVSVRDISERKRLDSQLLQSQKMETVGNLTGGIAHDFNNFLGVIIGNLDLLAHTVSDDEKTLKRVQKATQAALKGAELTKRLLAFSRKQTLMPRRIVLNEIVQGMENMIRRTIGADIDCILKLEEDLWPSFIDPHQFENVILNMAVNARDAMPNGGKLVIATHNQVLYEDSIEVAGGDLYKGNYVVLDISDTGCGIPPEEQDKIFEPFYTTKAEGQGTGLGLAMVYGFVKQSAGYLKLYSEVDYGSSFRIYLPKTNETADEEEETIEVLDSDALKGTETILLVDDEEDLLDVTAGQLEAAGYRAIRASNAKEALDLYRQNPEVDMLFTDIIMPGDMNGVQLANNIQDANPAIKVLLASGFPKQALDDRIGQDREYILLSKPYRETEMLKTVREILTAE